MNEMEYSRLAGHITEKLDNSIEYEDWLIIQEYVDELQSNLTKEQLAYINLRDTFNKLHQENQQLKEQLKQRDDVIDETMDDINLVIELIKQQPTHDDSWILQRLNSFKIVLEKAKGKK